MRNTEGISQKTGEYLSVGTSYQEESINNEYENQVLKLNTVLRVDSYLRTPYSIHMSYPSARSLYTIRLYMCKEESLVTMDLWGKGQGIKMLEEARRMLKPQKGDIIIELLPFTDKHYPCLYKTLQNLEVGHLLYNIGFLAEQYEKKYKVDNTFENILVLRQQEKGRAFAKDADRVDDFWRRAKMRSSGKYYGGIINFDLDYTTWCYTPQNGELMANIEFEEEVRDYVETLLFVNDGKKFISEKYGLECSYAQLMQEYHYVNFRTQSQIVLFIVKLPEDKRENYAGLIQYMGMLAQNICIENSCNLVYNRPIKQVRLPFWQPILEKSERLQGYVPFYGVITGKESTYTSIYQEIV